MIYRETREQYVERMQRSRQFKMFDEQPLWRPSEGDLAGFCHDEVVRQFHDPKVKSDGGIRITRMQNAWKYARQSAGVAPTVTDILALGVMIEPEHNTTIAFRSGGVWIGGEEGAPPRSLRRLVPALASHGYRVLNSEPVNENVGPHANDYRRIFAADPEHAVERVERLFASIETADDWYLAFEALHPFGDGNGRSGKILHNWLLGTLHDPVLVADYFGGGNP